MKFVPFNTVRFVLLAVVVYVVAYLCSPLFGNDIAAYMDRSKLTLWTLEAAALTFICFLAAAALGANRRCLNVLMHVVMLFGCVTLGVASGAPLLLWPQ